MTAHTILLALSPWTGRRVPCVVEGGWVVSQCGQVSHGATLVVSDEALARQLRGLGYWNVAVEQAVEQAAEEQSQIFDTPPHLTSGPSDGTISG